MVFSLKRWVITGLEKRHSSDNLLKILFLLAELLKVLNQLSQAVMHLLVEGGCSETEVIPLLGRAVLGSSVGRARCQHRARLQTLQLGQLLKHIECMFSRCLVKSEFSIINIDFWYNHEIFEEYLH